MTPSEAQAKLEDLQSRMLRFNFNRAVDGPELASQDWEYKLLVLWTLKDIADSLIAMNSRQQVQTMRQH